MGIEVGEILFVGDRMTPDGNDYPAAAAGALAVRVEGPEDTVRLCDALIGRCPGPVDTPVCRLFGAVMIWGHGDGRMVGNGARRVDSTRMRGVRHA